MLKEFNNSEGHIIRVGITNEGILKISKSSVKYVNRKITEEKIMEMYNSHKKEVINRRKRYISKTGSSCSLIQLSIMPYDKFRRIIIDECQMAGIPYEGKETERRKLKE